MLWRGMGAFGLAHRVSYFVWQGLAGPVRGGGVERLTEKGCGLRYHPSLSLLCPHWQGFLWFSAGAGSTEMGVK